MTHNGDRKIESIQGVTYRTALVDPLTVKVGDTLVLTKSVHWTVTRIAPYTGPLEELKGGVIAYSPSGGITLEPGTPVEILVRV
jgi:hypothetical protein